MPSKSEEVEKLLNAVSKGDSVANEKLFTIFYNELHRMAHYAMMREERDELLQTTALVHETFLSLIKNEELRWKNQAHFYSVAARAMRFILVDEARKRGTEKRGKNKKAVPLQSVQVSDRDYSPAMDNLKEMEALDTALEKLSNQHERKCTIVELRFFVGMTIDETAKVLGISKATVKRDWEFTREWLRDELKSSR